jgi:hypothetical protein
MENLLINIFMSSPHSLVIFEMPTPTNAESKLRTIVFSSSIVFAVVFGGALLGIFLRKLLPQNHLSDESKGIVMIAIG